MKKIKFFVLLTIVSMTFMLFIGCSGGGSDDPLPIQNSLPTLKISEATQISTTSAAFTVEVTKLRSVFTESGIIIAGTKIKLEPRSSTNYTMVLGLLTPNTTYNVKGYAVVPEGTAYSNEVSFKTNEVLAKITDADGNQIKIVKIGNQFWTAEDWKATHYRNGDLIPYITSDASWKGLNSGGRCIYNHDAKFPTILYNWYAATDSRGLAPVGWHVATQTDWSRLEGFIGDQGGYKIKEVGKTHWLGTNSLATNITEFTAIPSGYRTSAGVFTNEGFEARWLMIRNENDRDSYMSLKYDSEDLLGHTLGYGIGTTIRLVKD